jgi:hypothetical protein
MDVNIRMSQCKCWRKGPCTYCVCISSLGNIDTHSALVDTPQVFESVHRTMGKYWFLWLVCFLWLPSFPLPSPALFGGGGLMCFQTYAVACVCQSTDTNLMKLKITDFLWSQSYNIHAQFGHNVKQSWSCSLVFQDTIHDMAWCDNASSVQRHSVLWLKKALMEYMVQKWIAIKVNSYLMIDIVWELLINCLCPHFKKYFWKTTHLVETTVVSEKSYLPKCTYIAYRICTELWNMYSYFSRKTLVVPGSLIQSIPTRSSTTVLLSVDIMHSMETISKFKTFSTSILPVCTWPIEQN